MRALLVKTEFKLPAVQSTPSVELLSRLVPVNILGRFGLTRGVPELRSSPATAMDLMVVSHRILLDRKFDFSTVRRIVKSAAESCKSPLDWMLVYFGLGGSLFLNDAESSNGAVDVIVRGLGDPETKNFFSNLLEYTVVQLRHGVSCGTAERVQRDLKDAIEASAMRRDIIPSLRKMGSIQKFFEFDDDNDGKTFIFKLKKQRTDPPVSASETELQKLVNILKRQP
jgi:hypothetical protein